MAHPSSARQDTHESGLDEYLRLGGNAIHLHGEGGETHSRRAAGQWLGRRRLRKDFFVCTQVCHEAFDRTSNRAIDRFTPEAVAEDVAADLDLLETSYLDLIYLDDHPGTPVGPVIDAIAREIARGSVRAFGVRNWTAERMRAANKYASGEGAPRIAAVFTTELALAAATHPLWPGYVPFDAALESAAGEMGLAVFAHAEDWNLAQFLFEDEERRASPHTGRAERWSHPDNPALVERVRRFALARGLTTREVNLTWLLNRPFSTVAVVGLPSMLTGHGGEYERASRLRLDSAELRELTARPGG
jgi:aryl-alcohol dehydrogenase-like predicted oxidoreductase